MKKYLITLAIILATLWFSLTGLFNMAMANDYNKAVIGHVVQSKINGTNVDHGKLLESEIQKLGHQFALQMVGVMQQHLPYIMDKMMAEMRLELDKQHK
ncbi:MAG: hypothetical protein VW518_09935, partial [Burkholderiaceae bacterium]